METIKVAVQFLGVVPAVVETIWGLPFVPAGPSPNATMAPVLTPVLSVMAIGLAIALTWGQRPSSRSIRRRAFAVAVLLALMLVDLVAYTIFHTVVQTWSPGMYLLQAVFWALWIALCGGAIAVLGDVVWHRLASRGSSLARG